MSIKKIDLGNNSFFIGETFEVGANFSVGSNNIIRAKHFVAGDYVEISNNNNFLIGEKIVLGNCVKINSNNNVTGLVIDFGDYLYMDSYIEIGHGGKLNYDSKLSVGKNCMICSKINLNLNYEVVIGDNVGIGESVDIWTHGSYLNVLDGFPAQFGKVTIGNDVWIPAKSTVMPNITIGDNVVFGANSVITKDIPSGSLAAGMPAKILRENFYPRIQSDEEKRGIIEKSLSEYKKLCDFKKIECNYHLNKDRLIIKTEKGNQFDFETMIAKGDLNEKEEDFRDFFRRRGMKFFTGKPFRSILPGIYSDLLNYK